MDILGAASIAKLDEAEGKRFVNMHRHESTECDKLADAYFLEFAPTSVEQSDIVAVLVALRWQIDRVRVAEENARASAEFLGYNVLSTLHQLRLYDTELLRRYDHFVSRFMALEAPEELASAA